VIDVKVLRLDPDRVRASQRARGESESLVDDLVTADEARRNAIAHFEELRAEQKALGKQVAQASGEQRAILLSRTKELADMVKKAEATQNEIAIAFDQMLRQVGNLVMEDVPAGGEDDYVVLETLGTPRDFDAEGFRPKDHLELGQLLAAIDVERGAKVSGSRFYYLTGQGAELELALINLAMNTALRNDFIPFIPPALVKPQAMEGTGFLGQAAQDVYHLAEDDLYLVGTPMRFSTPTRCPAAMSASALAIAARQAPTARTQGASFECTGSTRSRCSSSARRRSPRQSIGDCCSGRRTSSPRSRFPSR
jgi:seryl-tRNA synthetase